MASRLIFLPVAAVYQFMRSCGRRLLRVLLMVALVCGCRSAPGAPPVNPIAPTTVVSPPPVGNPCRPSQQAPPGPISDPNGPYYHRTAVGRTADGVTLTDVRHVLEHASVPDGVRLADGRVLIYYVNGEDNSVWAASLEGSTATPLGAISLDGVSRPNGVVDPDAMMAGGLVRLAYLAASGPPSSGAARAMCLADSSDGLAFTTRGVALTIAGELWTDPSIVQLGDGRWLMAVSAGQQSILARSGDGLTFTAGERLSFGGVPELSALPDGRVRLYVCARGIDSYISPDGGVTWTREGSVVPGPGLACDPSMVAGTNLFVYKTGY